MNRLGLNKRVQKKFEEKDPIECIDILKEELRAFVAGEVPDENRADIYKAISSFLFLKTSRPSANKTKEGKSLFRDHFSFDAFIFAHEKDTFRVLFGIWWNYYVCTDPKKSCDLMYWSKRSRKIVPRVLEVGRGTGSGDKFTEKPSGISDTDYIISIVADMIREAQEKIENKENDPDINGLKHILPDKIILNHNPCI